MIFKYAMNGQPVSGSRQLILTLMLMLGLSACHMPAGASETLPRRGQASVGDPLAACGGGATPIAALTAHLMQGHASETSSLGECLANAAHNGSTAAAMVLAGSYSQAASLNGISRGKSAGMRLDLFGRYIAWLNIAAHQNYPQAQRLLAQETDSEGYRPMSDTTLAWYQTAAENGDRPALAAIGAGYSKGRILKERLYDLQSWLAVQAKQGAVYRPMLLLLDSPPAVILPN